MHLPLSLSNAQWELKAVDPATVSALARDLGVSSILARCMVLRGVNDSGAGGRMLRPDVSALHDPFLMYGMERAVERLRRAAKDRERVRVVTDYDVDGTTSSLILQAALKLSGGEAVTYHIPDRFEEGYGFSVRAAERAAADGVSLLVTADIGVRDHAAVTRAAELGVDVIICDHHLPADADVPADAHTVLCPPQKLCDYPNPSLAACGVSLKLAQALLGEHPRFQVYLRSLLKLAAIGTVADVVDLLTPENRAIVALGLEALNRGGHSPGLTALLEVAQAEVGRISSTDLGYRIGPRINAAGRVASAGQVVELLNTRDITRARILARELDACNSERRAIQSKLQREAKAMVSDPAPPFIVAAGPESEGWHRGVVGIVAGRLRDHFYRPCAIIAIGADGARGSVRSTGEVHAVHALDTASDLLDSYGGHPAAAGFSIKPEHIPALRERLEAAALEITGGAIPQPKRSVDVQVDADQVDWPLWRQLQDLGPHGKGNPSPRLQIACDGLRNLRILKERHLKFRVPTSRGHFDAIWWNASQHVEHFEGGAPVELLGNLSVNHFRGRDSLQFTVSDARVSPTGSR